MIRSRRTRRSIGSSLHSQLLIDADGKVDRISMKPVSPVADFSSDYQDLLFTPVAGQ